MNYIEDLKNKNITFNIINEYEAMKIMQHKYSYYKIMDYTCVFETYYRGENKGKFINVDFSQLYYLAEIDFRLEQILMCMCLEIENHLKTRLIYDAEKICDTDLFLSEYYNKDQEYIEYVYTSENIDIIKNKYSDICVKQMNFKQFIETIQFGTLERVIHFFYKKYAMLIYNTEFAPFERYLSCVKKIRNIVAHNNSIIDKLPIKSEYTDLKLMAFLGSNGIGHKTLKTNMSKSIVEDICGFLYVYFDLVNETDIFLNVISDFDKNYCQKYKKFFLKNDLLKSTYSFLKKVIEILSKNSLENHLTKHTKDDKINL